jgi:hypothetical protein
MKAGYSILKQNSTVQRSALKRQILGESFERYDGKLLLAVIGRVALLGVLNRKQNGF